MTLFKRLFSYLSSYRHQNNNNMLGRWNIHYDEQIIHKKVEQANEDHCGVCIINQNEQIKKQSYDYDDEYYKIFIL